MSPPPPMGATMTSMSGMLLKNFQAESSLPRDDRVVIEGVNRASGRSCSALLDRLVVGLVVVRAVQNDFGAVGASRRNFRQRSGKRHHDAGVDAVASGVVGDALRVIAGRGGDHAAGALFAAEREQFVQRAALLECSGALLVVEFQENGIVGQRRKMFPSECRERCECRREFCSSADLDVGELDHD